MTLAEFLTVLIAFCGLALGVRSYIRDQRRDRETAKVNVERFEFEKRINEENTTITRQLFDIEARRHQWELEARDLAAAEREGAEEKARSAKFAIRFAYRDSAHTWARILATNHGEAMARNVRFEVWGARDGGHQEIEPLGGTDYRNANQLQPGESVHVGVVFTLASPQPEDLRYRVSWEDDQGEQEIEGQVPVD